MLLSLALLVAQLGAEAHAYSHLASDPPGVPSTSQGCETCLSFAPLLNAVGGSQCVLLAIPCAAERIVPGNTISIPYLLPRLAFQPRAPPKLL